MEHIIIKIFLILLVGFLIGITVSTTYTIENKYLQRVLVKSMNRNSSVKEVFYTLYPKQYKLHYTDWKKLNKIDVK